MKEARRTRGTQLRTANAKVIAIRSLDRSGIQPRSGRVSPGFAIFVSIRSSLTP
jgi:hypothetical protein